MLIIPDLSSFGNLDERQEVGHLQKRFFLSAVAIFVYKNNLASGDRAFATCDSTREYTRFLRINIDDHKRATHHISLHVFMC